MWHAIDNIRNPDDDADASLFIHNNSEIIQTDGDCFELLVGFVLGFVLGLIAALCLVDRSGIAGVRFKAGVFLGMSCYLLLLFGRFVTGLVDT